MVEPNSNPQKDMDLADKKAVIGNIRLLHTLIIAYICGTVAPKEKLWSLMMEAFTTNLELYGDNEKDKDDIYGMFEKELTDAELQFYDANYFQLKSDEEFLMLDLETLLDIESELIAECQNWRSSKKSLWTRRMKTIRNWRSKAKKQNRVSHFYYVNKQQYLPSLK
ncbi:MAG: hypothetical protein LBO69_06015 [Ignavibacteria bacterium]|jgi:hypothetical protein|nr:hypothetical protein [Ignavibacteria bacterium]